MYNSLKRKLKKGETTFGSWMTIGNPLIAEYLSRLPFDWFLFDQEHSPLIEQSTVGLLQAMEGSTVTPLIRPAWSDQVLIKKALDIGAHGLLLPMINSAEDAQKAVAACKYPPEGIRGCGPARSSVLDSDYFSTANDEVLIIVQIESQEAVHNAEAILSTEGIDMFFVGPMDLSYSLGLRGNMNDPILQEAIDHVFSAGREKGLAGGIWQGGGKTLQARIDEGWQFIGIGLDAFYLIEGAKQTLREVGREA